MLGESLTTPSAPPSRATAGNGRWRCISVRRRTRPPCARWSRLVGRRCGGRRAHARDGRAADWVTQSLAGLRPVRAGRFIVHGAHDRARIEPNDIGIEIEAALAFGTGHHGTTRGCLLALDDLAKRGRARRVLDVGTGSGVLAIAAAKIFRTRVVASDIDRVAVEAARANARLNRAGATITFVHADGVNARAIAAGAPYDLIFANILLGPLMRLAVPLRAPRRPARAHRAVRPAAEPRQCRAGDLPRAGLRARAAHPARWLGHAGVAVLDR